ncbi:UNVERIFIED_CONTAM: Heat shock factor protein 2 [Trichonephila clavipes]
MGKSKRFQFKLWRVVNRCQTNSVRWSETGDSIIFNFSKFKKEYLDPNNDFCKSDNISSFIRQLNLYGFRKMIDLTHTTQYSNGDKEYLNPYFVKGRPDLLHQVARNSLRSSVKVSPILKKDKPGDNEKRNGNKECFVPPKPGTYWLQPTGLCSSNPKCKHSATVLSNKKLKDKCCDSNCFRKQTQIQKEVHYSPFSDSQYDLVSSFY